MPDLSHLRASTWWDEADAREFFAAHAESDLELPAFAKLHGISIARAYRWRTKLGVVTPRPAGKPSCTRGTKQEDDLAPKLLMVALRDHAAPTSAAATVAIVVNDRFRLLVEPGFDPDHLRAILEVIGQC
jgi:hypothetical protein